MLDGSATSPDKYCWTPARGIGLAFVRRMSLSRQDTPSHVAGLDALRAACALVVVLGHIGGPPIAVGLDRSTVAGYLVGGALNNLWNGPAAVIAFFVISGFCIHYPFAHTLRIPLLPSYAVRRLLRVGLPLLFVVGVAPALGVSLSLFHAGILWSLLAELVYYLLYPALLRLRRHGVAWRSMWIGAFGIGVLMAATNPRAGDYGAFGPSLNWLLGLPCWLAGCDLAERAATHQLPRTTSIWRWRLGVWACAVAVSILRFHSPIGYPWTLNLFAVLVWFWVGVEISRTQARDRSRAMAGLEWMGAWSYSLYLVHVPALAAWRSLAVFDSTPFLDWLQLLTFVLVVSYAFYQCIERPSHVIARRLAGQLAQRWARPTRSAGLEPDTATSR
jgi:peptidoglycan/LPS O-acetylase OafA/YrhL